MLPHKEIFSNPRWKQITRLLKTPYLNEAVMRSAVSRHFEVAIMLSNSVGCDDTGKTYEVWVPVETPSSKVVRIQTFLMGWDTAHQALMIPENKK